MNIEYIYKICGKFLEKQSAWGFRIYRYFHLEYGNYTHFLGTNSLFLQLLNLKPNEISKPNK